MYLTFPRRVCSYAPCSRCVSCCDRGWMMHGSRQCSVQRLTHPWRVLSPVVLSLGRLRVAGMLYVPSSRMSLQSPPRLWRVRLHMISRWLIPLSHRRDPGAIVCLPRSSRRFAGSSMSTCRRAGSALRALLLAHQSSWCAKRMAHSGCA